MPLGAACMCPRHPWSSFHLPSCLLVRAGFRPDPLYPEFSADFFDAQHFVLRGSSPYTHPALARRSFRNFYQRLYPYVFAKFRLAWEDGSSPAVACSEP